MASPAIVFDMDGTLLDAESAVIGGRRTLDLLTRLQEAGCTMGICTGRLDHDIVRAGQRYGLRFPDRISQHGAVTVSGDRLDARLMDKAEALAILERLEETAARIEVNTVSNRYWTSERDPDFPKELYDSHVICQDFRELIECQPVVLFLVIGDEGELAPIAAWVEAHCERTLAVMSSPTSLEIMSSSVSKGQAVGRLYADHDVYAIGDAQNDFDMLAAARRGYLVSDVPCTLDVTRVPSITEALEDIAGRVLG